LPGGRSLALDRPPESSPEGHGAGSKGAGEPGAGHGSRSRTQIGDESLEITQDREPEGEHESPRLETARDQSRPIETDRGAILEAAIDRLTRALVSVDDDVIPELVAERRGLREELHALREAGAGNVIDLGAHRKK
jgi:hypothetical protein